MRIFLNGLVVKRGGHKTYFSNFIPQFGIIGQQHEFVLLHSAWQNAFDFDLPSNFTRLIDGPDKSSVPMRMWWEQTRLPAILHRERIDVVFNPTPAGMLLYPGYPAVIAIRNPNPFSPLTIKSWRYRARNRALREFTNYAARRAAAVIFVSKYSRDVALKAMRIDPSKVFVIYHGVGAHFFEPAQTLSKKNFHGDRPYLLTVSTVQSHKNYPRFLNAFAKLCREPDLGYDYVFAGGIGSRSEFESIQQRINKLDLQGRVHYLGEVSYWDLPTLYQGASLFVLPSLLETFGHPLVEAMASHIPIAASNAAAIPEISGDAAVYFNPYDEDEICTVLQKLIYNKELREQLILKGSERVKKFSWENTAREMVKVFEVASREDGR